MKNIIFVRTRWDYQSYTDYWRMVELSEFPVVYVDEMEIYNPDNIYIVSPMNGEWRPFIDDHFPAGKQVELATLVLWNLERPGGNGSVADYKLKNQELIKNGYIDHIVVSDYHLAKLCGFDYMPFGIHEKFGEPGPYGDKWFDIIHLSCFSSHRSWMFDYPDRPKQVLHDLVVAPNGWGVERDRRLKQSKFMLNVHQDGLPFIEPIRFAIAAAYGLPIFSESCMDFRPYRKGCDVFDMNFASLKNVAVRYSGDYSYYETGLRTRHYMLKHFQFRTCVETYVRDFVL